MRALFAWLLILGFFLTASAAQARDSDYKLKVADVLQNPEFKTSSAMTSRFISAARSRPLSRSLTAST